MENFFIEESTINQQRFESEFLSRRGEFENCKFEGMNFEKINLSHYKFIDCNFKDCNFSNSNMKGASFRNPYFANSKMIGINWTLLSNFGQLKFSHSILNFSSFQGMSLLKSKFLECQMEEVDFAGSFLKDVEFTSSNLLGSNFNQANLTNADLRKCVGVNIDLTDTIMLGAKVNVDCAMALVTQLGITVE